MGRARDLVALTKPRAVAMVVATTAAGFHLGSAVRPGWLGMVHVLVGTALAAGGTIALNQYVERDRDALMARTRGRPLPAGRVRPAEGLAFGVGLCAGGLLYLAATAHPLSALLTALTVASYLLAYTPLKRRSPLSTVVGAVPGALPPMIGWAAARGTLEAGAWMLFAILFLWQVPHALAIAVLHREDYARAGFRLLPVLDLDGRRTGGPVVSHCFALLLVAALPALTGLAGPLYFFGALACGLAFLGCGLHLALAFSPAAARRLLHASLLYLPAVLALLAFDKTPY